MTGFVVSLNDFSLKGRNTTRNYELPKLSQVRRCFAATVGSVAKSRPRRRRCCRRNGLSLGAGDSSAPGFNVRVHQAKWDPVPANSIVRAEDQLAGSLSIQDGAAVQERYRHHDLSFDANGFTRSRPRSAMSRVAAVPTVRFRHPRRRRPERQHRAGSLRLAEAGSGNLYDDRE